MYKTIITVAFGSYEESFPLDICTERNVSVSANIATHPVQSGNSVSDHMWHMPTVISLSGKFADRVDDNTYTLSNEARAWLTDHEGSALIDAMGSQNSRVSRVEALFEYINRQGLLCKISMVDVDAGKKPRFLIRTNMALAALTWKEELNTVAYSFTFKEIVTVQLQAFETSDVPDSLFPDLSAPSARTLGQALATRDTEDICQLVIAALLDCGYISKKDGEYVISYFGDGGTYAANQSALSGALKGTVVGASAGFVSMILTPLIAAIIAK